MSKKDLAASIRQWLLNLAKERGEDFNFILTQYAIQRVLYRLSISVFRDRFLLKGAWLFSVWSKELHRPTRDADFLGLGDNNVEHLLATFKQICNLAVEDGLTFDMDSFEAITIKEDAIPGTEQAVIPVYLDLPAPELKVYPVYSVIAEKFQAMVEKLFLFTIAELRKGRRKDYETLVNQDNRRDIKHNK